MVRFTSYLILVIIFIFSVLTPNKALAQTVCQNISGCTNLGTNTIKEYNLDADAVPECRDQRTRYNCSGTECFQDSTTCTEVQSICNNGVGNTPGDEYTCDNYCSSLAIPDHCGNYPASDLRPTCSAYIQKCLDQYCRAVGGGTNYTCPSPQECISPPDAKAHQCITPVVTVTPPSVSLTVNNTSVITINKGDTFVLSWNITGSASNCSGSNAWINSDAPATGPSSGLVSKSLTDAGTYVYTLTCTNSAGSDSKGVSVNVNKTCPDYNSCSSCVGQNTCGWKGDNSTCQTGTSACPANTTAWYWTDCLTNACTPPSPPPTSTPTTCTGSPTCSISATATSATSGRATITQTGGCSTGYNRVEWFLNNISQGSNLGPAADFNNLTTNTTYPVSAKWWSTDLNKPAVSCGSASFTLQSSYTTPTTPTTTTTIIPLVCLRGPGNCDTTGNATWSSSWTSKADGTQCNYPKGTTANTFPAVVGKVCWQPLTSSTAAPQEINGEIWIREPNQSEANQTQATSSFYQSAADGKIWFWFSHFPRYEGDPLPFSGHCHNKASLNNAQYCFQGDRVDPIYRAYIGYSDANVGRKSNSADIPVDHLKLIQWPSAYKPIGYYEYQEVQAINSRTQCASNATYTCSDPCHRGTDATSIAFNCSSCGGVSCENQGGCSCSPTEIVNDGYECRTKPRSNLKELETLPQGGFNHIASYCDPTGGNNARIDLVFRKETYQISGKVVIDSNGDNTCDQTETDAAGYSSSATITLSGTAAYQQTTNSLGNFSFTNLRAGNYSLSISSIPSYRLIPQQNQSSLNPLSNDAVVNFCITSNPDAWLKTTGGDVHSNTGINTPGGP